MVYDLQKGSLWKRFAAWMFDGILTAVLAVGAAFLLSALLGYDGYSQAVDQAYAQYETQYGVTFQITQEEYAAMTDPQRQQYDAAYEALIADSDAMYAYSMMLNLTLVITSISILAAVMVWEFLVPLLLGNGQTLGKKIFSLCLVRSDGVRVNNMQLFTRALLGKFTIETMIPVVILLMLFWGTLDLTGTAILVVLLAAQCAVLGCTKTNALIHDLLAGTAVADFSSQMIFSSTEDLIAYQKKIHAERAARQDY